MKTKAKEVSKYRVKVSVHLKGKKVLFFERGAASGFIGRAVFRELDARDTRKVVGLPGRKGKEFMKAMLGYLGEEKDVRR